MDIKNRRGTIRVSENILYGDSLNADVLKGLFSVFYPVHIERGTQFSEYGFVTLHGYSPFFRELEKAERAPSYEATMHVAQGVFSHVTFKELELSFG